MTMATLNYSKCTATDAQIADKNAHRKIDTDLATTKETVGAAATSPPTAGGGTC